MLNRGYQSQETFTQENQEVNDSTLHRKIRMNPTLISAFPQSIHTKKKGKTHEKAHHSEYITLLFLIALYKQK